MKIRSLTLLFVTAMALTSCASNTTDSTAEGGADGGAFPVTIDTKFGAVAIESQPERVVALGWGDAETALALGAQPVGASDWLAFGGDGVGPWAQGLYKNPPELIGTMEPSFEALAALAPDLILDTKSSGDKSRNDLLAKIAPTVGMPAGSDAYLTSLDDQVTSVATALGVPAKGEDLLAQIDSQYAEAKTAYPEFAGKTVTVIAYTSEGWGAYVTGDSRVDFMTELGFVNNPRVQAVPTENFFIPVSEENLDMLDADFVIGLPIYMPTTDVTNNALFQQIPAVKDGRFIVLDSDSDISAAFSTNSVLSIPFALEQLVPLVAERVS
ncbi:iron-siderophore ABC transporter substrate-binding protein [Rhodococcus sp. KBS0724]|jgi:iron complex transport system substrate-binding protein|uniref:iron-siderophore ABC transporter substrate-binding protein n=1 Tax=Rhodococcus sp. KBS0724 TaxID=1179674 RepID=UPI00110DAA3F|nr:iron-siderophore ABC transporter substrate-binding protein [Rhodococcus sp. KBS0724]TSD45801.1 iron-siderophore ABC transporter substrate-binding protein [Rhodococcus sp. KBS0724]